MSLSSISYRNTFFYKLNEYDLAVLRFSRNLYVIFVELDTIRYHRLEIPTLYYRMVVL